MGAQLVGFLAKGPARIDSVHLPDAVLACRRNRIDLLGGDGDHLEFDPGEIPADPTAGIEAFIAWWNDAEGSYDTCWCADPEDENSRLVFAGETSNGDEPDGTGYQMLKRAFCWGFAEALGVRDDRHGSMVLRAVA